MQVACDGKVFLKWKPASSCGGFPPEEKCPAGRRWVSNPRQEETLWARFVLRSGYAGPRVEGWGKAAGRNSPCSVKKKKVVKCSDLLSKYSYFTENEVRRKS